MSNSKVMQLCNTMAEKGSELDIWMDRLDEDPMVTLSPAQVTEILRLIGGLTLINTGINGAHIEESALHAAQESGENKDSF